MSHQTPKQGRIAGIDYGKVRIGIAITDSTQTVASPLRNYERGKLEQDAQYFKQLVADEDVVGFVVGLPVHSSGDESEKSMEARRFGAWLAAETGLPVAYYDERYSSLAADRVLAMGALTSKKRKQRRDMLAAQIILSAFLESTRDGGEAAGPLGG